MDRISPTTLGQRALGSLSHPLGQAKPVGPRAIDPSARLRIVDRQDTVSLRSIEPSASAPAGAAQANSATPANPLAATLVASVVEPAPTAGTSAPVSTRAADALKMYAAPGEQNVAATRAAAGSLLDIRA